MASAVIYDNYLPKTYFKKLQKWFLSSEPNWKYNQHKVKPSESTNSFQFVHTLYRVAQPQKRKRAIHTDLGVIRPLLDRLEPSILLKVKANITPRTAEPDKTDFHTDYPPILNHSTGIIYFNTNNGYTEFEDGKIVESVANRAVFFQGSERHRGVSCTDSKVRVVLNVNFFPKILV